MQHFDFCGFNLIILAILNPISLPVFECETVGCSCVNIFLFQASFYYVRGYYVYMVAYSISYTSCYKYLLMLDGLALWQ